MSDYYDDKDSYLSQEEVLEIQEEYRLKRLMESIIGPTLSTLFHISLIGLLAYFIQDTYKKDDLNDVKVTIVEDQPIPPLEVKPEEPEIPKEIKVVDPKPTKMTVEIEVTPEADSALEDTNDDIPQTDDNLNMEQVTDVTVSTSNMFAPSMGGRDPGGRAGMVTEMGGTPTGQIHLEKALKWLQKVQNPNGSWGSKNQQAYTGLALLTFLAHGDTHISKEYGHTVKNAMQWLAYDTVYKKHGNGYGHAIKTYALCEAYAMTGLPLLENVMNKCVRIIIDGQQNGGGYHYGYNRNENEKQDLSIAGWNYQALKAAYGAQCDEEGLVPAIYKSIEWLKRHGGGDDNGNGFPYNVVKSPTGKKHTMRAVGVLCLQLYGEGNTPEIKDELDAIVKRDLQNLSFANAPQESLYGWYYATQAMFQKQGKHWNAWRKVFERELVKNQHSEGYWEYPGKWHGETHDLTTDRVYATTLCSLMLTVYYRYLPGSKTVIKPRTAKGARDREIESLDLLD